MYLCVLFYLWLVWQLFVHSVIHSFIQSTNIYWLAAGGNPRGWERRHTARQRFEGKVKKGRDAREDVDIRVAVRVLVKNPTGYWGRGVERGPPHPGELWECCCWCRKCECGSQFLKLHFATRFLVLSCSRFSTSRPTKLWVCVFLRFEIGNSGDENCSHYLLSSMGSWKVGLWSQSWVWILVLPPMSHSCMTLVKLLNLSLSLNFLNCKLGIINAAKRAVVKIMWNKAGKVLRT